jgi:hypothetical protein
VDALKKKPSAVILQKLFNKKEKLDISFNAIGVRVVQNIPLVDISVDDFIGPVTNMTKPQFPTATAAGKIMMKQGS